MKKQWYIADIPSLARDLHDWVGDFDLTCVERIALDDVKEDEFEEQMFEIRLAPLHLHQTSRYRRIVISYRQLDTMMTLEWTGDPEDSYYLAPLTTLFSEVPEWMMGKELGVVHILHERPDGDYVAHVSSITLHLAGPITKVAHRHTWDDWCDMVEQQFPLHEAPCKPHTCRQQKERGNSFANFVEEERTSEE